MDDRPWETNAIRVSPGSPTLPPLVCDNVASPISATTKLVASNATPARAHFLGCLAKTVRRSAAPHKPTAPKRSSIQAKPEEKSREGADPIIVTESEDNPTTSRSKQSQRKPAISQLKPANGGVKGKGKTQGLQHDDPIDVEPPDDVSDVSDVEMSIPAPGPRSSPNELSPVSAKEEALQRKLLQASFPSRPSVITTK